MAQKQQRGNREAKKPKQNKTKVAASVSPFTPPSKSGGKGSKHK